MSQENKGCRFHQNCNDADILCRDLYRSDATHEPYPDPDEIRELKSHITELEEKVAGLESQKDQAYSERNRVLSLFAVLAWKFGWRVGRALHPETDKLWDKVWRNILFIDLPTGQASWHFHDNEVHLLGGLPEYPDQWDGHTTPEKYKRLESVKNVLFDQP
jgi:hypothetical protein